MFLKYSSLENSYRQVFVDKCERMNIRDWVSLEKLHGANFGFAFDNGDISACRRTGVIEEYSAFYGCTPVVKAHHEKIQYLASMLKLNKFIIYGELVGKNIPNSMSVVYGDKDFFAYDIYNVETDQWLEWDYILDVCAWSGIKTVPEISRGTLTEMLSQSPEFRSKLTPADHEGDNGAEGLVIKQLQNEVIMDSGKRAILKLKAASFLEKKNKSAKTPTKLVLTPEEEQFHKDFSLYLTEARLQNVLSKIGKVEAKQFSMVSGLLIQDAKAEFERDELDETPIDKFHWSATKRSLSNIANELIRKDWLNIIDGVF